MTPPVPAARRTMAARAWRSAGVAVLAALALAACAAAPTRAAESAQDRVFVVVRHAEKAGDGTDPGLSEAGQRRAARLAARLVDAPVIAVHATGLRRTRDTVAPTARAHGLPLATYDAHEPAPLLVARLLASQRPGVVLVAGHSNTVPEIVAALCRCAVPPMPEHEFDRISTVSIDAAGCARLRIEHD